MNTKTTYASAVEYALSHLTDAPASVQEKLTALLASLEKKSNAERKPTKTQTENAGYKQDILAWMTPNTLYSVTDVTKGVPSIAKAELSNARVSAMLTQLVKDAHALVREEVKGKAYFKLA
jgi:hypothetical protein